MIPSDFGATDVWPAKKLNGLVLISSDISVWKPRV